MVETSGHYGTLRLLSKSGKAVQTFPVDSDVLTFGRDQSCDVRMYFTFVSPLHAKLVFEDGKALLSVMGKQGVVIDGGVVIPSSSGEPSITVLKDDSKFTIHNKTFRFEYPPKELRATFLATPPPKSRKSLRMSMINAARIMTPNTRVTPSSPSLEVLQTPVKPYADIKNSAERDLEVILAEGDDVLVSKQGNDLVVLESFARAPIQSNGGLTSQDADDQGQENSDDQGEQIESPPDRPRTPHAQISLHKAVLVRNSRLAIIERNDEEEVIEALSPERANSESSHSLSEDGGNPNDLSEDSEHGADGEGPLDAGGSENDDDEVREDIEEEVKDEPSPKGSLGLRASIEAIGKAFIFPFSGRWSSGEPTNKVADDDETSDSESGDDEALREQDSDSHSLVSERRDLSPTKFSAPRGLFLTPQAPSHARPTPRMSVSDEGAKREGSSFDTKPITRRSRFSTFGLPDYILDAAAHEDNEEDGVPEVLENVATSAPSNDRQSIVGKASTPTETIPAPAVHTPSLDTLRKRVRIFQLDNAKRASRLSFGVSPVSRMSRASVANPSISALERKSFESNSSQHTAEVDADIKSARPDSVGGNSEDVQIKGPIQSEGSQPNSVDIGPRSPSPQRSKFSFIGDASRQPPPKTPSFTGFKNLFAAPAASPSTPSLSGMRQLFRFGEPPATSNFSGVRDILSVPEDEDDRSSGAGSEENPTASDHVNSVKIAGIDAESSVSSRQAPASVPVSTAAPKRTARLTRKTTPADSTDGSAPYGKAATTHENEQGSDLPVAVSDSTAAPRTTRSRGVHANTESSGVTKTKPATQSTRASSKSSSRIPTSAVSHDRRGKSRTAEVEEPEIKSEDNDDDGVEDSTSLSRAVRTGKSRTPAEESTSGPRSTTEHAKSAPSTTRATGIPVKTTSGRRTRASPAEPAKSIVSKRGHDSDTEEDTPSASGSRSAATKTRGTSGARAQRSARKVPATKHASDGVKDSSSVNNPRERKRLRASEDDETTVPKMSGAIAPKQATRKTPARGSKASSVKKQSPVVEVDEADSADKENAPGSVASSEEEELSKPVKAIRTTRKTPARKVTAMAKESLVTPTNEDAPPARALRTRSAKK